MKRNIKITIFLIVLVIGLIGVLLINKKESKKLSVANNKKVIAYMYQDENGEYKPGSSGKWLNKYILNMEMSECSNKDEAPLQWDYINDSVITPQNESLKCTLYFDRVPSIFDNCPEENNLVSCIKSLDDKSQNEYADGKGVLYHHDGTIMGLNYNDKNGLYIMDEYSNEYTSIDDVITYDTSYHLTYELESKNYNSFALAAEQAVKDGYLGIDESVVDIGDDSYRYAGDNPNNFICFGAGSEDYNNGKSKICPDTNLYRVMGYVPVKVPGSEEGTTETKNLIKVIKSEYVTASEIGREAPDNTIARSSYPDLKRVKANSFDAFHWDDAGSNIWADSSLYRSFNTDNNSFIHFLDYGIGEENKTWSNKIENVFWQLSGRATTSLTAKEMYDSEIINPNKQASGKIGLMNIYEYGFTAVKDLWTTYLGGYGIDINRQNNWLFNGVKEWTITPRSTYGSIAYSLFASGAIRFTAPVSYCYAIRPVFYLTSDVSIINDATTNGSEYKPYKVK